MSRPSAILAITLTAALATALAAPPARAQQIGQQRFASLDEALRSGGILAGRSGPIDVNWIDNGKRFSYIDRDPNTGRPIIRALDVTTGHDTTLFTGDGLTLPGTSQPFAYDSFQWAHDSKHLLFRTNAKQIFRRSATADYYMYTLATRQLTLAAQNARTAELSPDGAFVGYERDGDMYVANLATGQERRLTNDASEHVFNGHFDWVYEEEFGMAQAWNWSHDSRYIAFWQSNDSKEPVIQLTNYEGQHPDWEQLRIPQPGDTNATVRIGVVDVQTGKRTWLVPEDTGDFYIPRIYWTSRPDTLAMITLNRQQNLMSLYFFDVKTGGRRLVMRETSKTWIDVYDFYAGIQDMMTFPEGSHEFFWISDRDGWQHVYRYDYSGKLIQQITHGTWSVTRVEGMDAKRGLLFYSSTQDSPLQRQLYEIRLDGTHARKLTSDAGTHHINMAPDGQYYIDHWSSVHHPTQVVLRSTATTSSKMLEDNAATTQWLASHAYSPAETFSFTSSDHVRIDGNIIKPFPFDSTKKYPVIFAVYGGPGSQEVYDEFGSSGWSQWLAQHGYIVIGVNNRGTNNYGSAFMKTVYKQLGKWESHDFAETARYLATLPYVDASNIAIVGTSYGGYSVLYTMEMYPELFKAGIANSGVTDWRYYDTIYTERYMGLLGDNLAGYESSSAIVNASKLSGKLLLIHAMMDDNVHPQHTMQLLTALTNAGKDVDLRIYPPGRHGSAYDYKSYRLIQQVSEQFLDHYLKGIVTN